MTHTPPKVTDAELAVLKKLWQQGPSTIRELTDLLYPGGGASLYATVQKLLDRLEAKACVTRKKKGRAHLFSAAIERADLIRHSLREAAEKLCEGSLTPLFSNLVSANSLTRKEIKDLRSMLDDLERGSQEG